ncbi:DUF397 domain-containing protein [Streptomyces alboflavus]
MTHDEKPAAAAWTLGIRDSKNPDGPALLLALPAWTAFLTSIVES